MKSVVDGMRDDSSVWLSSCAEISLLSRLTQSVIWALIWVLISRSVSVDCMVHRNTVALSLSRAGVSFILLRYGFHGTEEIFLLPDKLVNC